MGQFRLWSSILVLPIAWIAWNVYRLTANYATARRVGVPLVVVPINPESPAWMLVSELLWPYITAVLSWFPLGSGSFLRYGHRGWDVQDRAKSFLELGDAFILVTAGKNWLYICNAETITEMLHRKNEFRRPLEIMAVLDIFGQNLSTVEDKDWQRHRKATGPPFGEPNMIYVWNESIRQAKEMLEYWSKSPDIRYTAKDARRFSLHVLSATGFGKPHPFDRATEKPPEAGSLTYKESLALILENAILIMLLGPNLLTGSLRRYLPKHWSLVGQATRTFKSHIAGIIADEKKLIAEGKANPGNFIGAMVRASEDEASAAARDKLDRTEGRRSNLGLTESEVFGNIFVFNFAGHDSIAITLTYMITHLAAYPEIQQWIAEEIEHVCKNPKDSTAVPYAEAYPRLKRCLAVLYETLRTSTPFPAIVKNTGPVSRTLNIGAKRLHLPPGMNIISTFPSIHSHPRYWGDDVDLWRPTRWIKTIPDSNNAGNSIFDRECLVSPPRGSFMPWSDGDRVCPGKRYSHVELVGALTALFADGWRVEPVCNEGESMDAAKERTKDVIKDSGVPFLVEMLHPERVGLRWVKR